MSEQLNLFPNPQSQRINLPNSEIWHYPQFFSYSISDQLFQQLHQEINWTKKTIALPGKTIPLPRLSAWYGDQGNSYTYSGITMHPQPWTLPLLWIKEQIEAIAPITFNSVLANLYRNGQDSVSWHSDNEPELGKTPIIGSVSFGATRKFSFKPKKKGNQQSHDIHLKHGDLLLMQGETQKYWLHQNPKTRTPVTARINLTFRQVL
jgi:alkylated DNA repair dioxygenase AlkB